MKLSAFLVRMGAVLCVSAIVVASGSEPQEAPKSFTLQNVAPAAGLNFKQINFATDMKYPFETLGGAVAALDYNNDGSWTFSS